MGKKAEYDGEFWKELDSIMSFPADTRRDVQAHAAEARRRVLRKRDFFTGEITKAWKEGFALLKKENDEMQADLRKAQKDAFQLIDEITADKIVGLQK